MNESKPIGESMLEVLLQGAMSAVPVVGGFMAATLNEVGIRKTHERITLLEKQLEEIGINSLSIEYLNSEDGFEVLARSVRHIAISGKQTKAQLLAKIIKGHYVSELVFDNAGLFLEIISRANCEEIAYLSALCSAGCVDNLPLFGDEEEFDTDPAKIYLSLGLPRERMFYMFKRLESLGLVRYKTMMIYNSTMMYTMNPEAISLIEFLHSIDP